MRLVLRWHNEPSSRYITKSTIKMCFLHISYTEKIILTFPEKLDEQNAFGPRVAQRTFLKGILNFVSQSRL